MQSVNSKISLAASGIILLGLCSMAISLALFNTLGNGATFFVAHNALAADIIAFALRIYLVPAILLTLLVAFCAIWSQGLAAGTTALLVGLLSGLWLLAQLHQLPGLIALPAAIVAVPLVATAYRRSQSLRSFLLVLGWVSPLLLLYFLFMTPVYKLLDAGAGVAPEQFGGRKTPVVVLVLDELSQAAISREDGSIDAGRLPNFARLADMSTWYNNTTTASVQTERAISSLLSGLHTAEKVAPVYAQFPQNLFTLVAPSHRVQATETVSRFCPRSVCDATGDPRQQHFDRRLLDRDAGIILLHAILPADFAGAWLPPISSSWRDFNRFEEKAEDTDATSTPWFVTVAIDMSASDSRRFQQFLQRVDALEPGSLAYLHLGLPHVPWIYLPDGSVYNGQFTPGQSKLAYDWLHNQFLIDQGALRYSLQVEYVDSLVGKLIERLRANPHFNDSLVVVISDHGIAFAPGQQRRTPVPANLADVARIPLFIKYPGQDRPRIDKRPAQTIDLLPTVADVLGLPLDKPVHGQSLVAADWKTPVRLLWEGRESITDMEAQMDMATAIARIQRAVRPDQSALNSLGQGPGARFFGQAEPAMESRKPAGTGALPELKRAGLERDSGSQLVGALPELNRAGLERNSGGQVTDAVLELNRAAWFQHIRMDSQFLPVRLTGRLKGVPVGTPIVIGLNGFIAGSGESFGSEGEVSVMLDPRRFRDGGNTLRAYLIVGGQLQAIGVDQGLANLQLQRDAGGKLVRVRGRQSTWEPAQHPQGLARANYAWQSTPLGNISGWVHDGDSAAEQLLLIEGDKVVAGGFHQFPHPIYSAGQGLDEQQPYWYALEIKPALRNKTDRLSVLALFANGHFIELPLQQ